MILKIFKKIPPSISVFIFYVFIGLGMLFRFLLASVYGMFIMSIGLYFYYKNFTHTPPFSSIELLNWAFALPSNYKTAILTSSVTITGFAIAFHTATINWRNQMQAQLKTQAANEIENFFAFVATNIQTMELYIKSLINIIDKLQEEENTIESIAFSIGYAQGKATEHMAARDALSQASIDVHRLIGKNHNMLSTAFGLLPMLQQTAVSLSKVTKKMWVHIPIVDLNHESYLQSFINQLNIAECTDFLETCGKNKFALSGLSGGVQGALTSSIWGFSFPMFWNLLLTGKEFKGAITELHEQLNADES
ncbi:MAG: hypothetical protein KKE62_06400 [Proteobacteria bacterium]|nr:hypothetical protein [Pseudomonadota bacterium]MBU1542460.1 hypothetical protein [Pseudomonadota bacterium]MBU2481768.1 hypothetical protein [Pseudomonadota bacterium]